jgi:SNF2 family DNA or RNA helicase
VTRDTFSGDLDLRKPQPWKTVILDELSGFKNRGTQRWRAANKLVKTTPYVWGLTGTPMPNGFLDLWPQVFLLDRGARLGRTITSYRSTHFTPGKRLPNGIVTKYNLNPGSKEIIEASIADLCLSIDKSHAKYPIQNDVYHYFDLTPKVRKAYQQMLDHYIADIGETKATVEHAAAKSAKLSQIAAGFMYHSGLIGAEESDEAEITHHHMLKMEALQEILEDAQGAPALVFYRFKEDRRRLLQLEGAVDIKTPHSVDRWNRGNIPILIAHPGSAGHGLNLQRGGSLMVWYSMDWSSEYYTQGIGRLVRQGQPSPAVAVHHLLARDTVDEEILAVVQGKISRQDALLRILERGKRKQ